jgi:hypothetical protein
MFVLASIANLLLNRLWWLGEELFPIALVSAETIS